MNVFLVIIEALILHRFILQFTKLEKLIRKIN
jgi:hypothetical protein